MARDALIQELYQRLEATTRQTEELLRQRDVSERERAAAEAKLARIRAQNSKLQGLLDIVNRDNARLAEIVQHVRSLNVLISNEPDENKKARLQGQKDALLEQGLILREQLIREGDELDRYAKFVSSQTSENDKDGKGKKKSIQVKAKKKPAGMDGEDKPSVEHAVDRHPFSEMLQGHDIAQVIAVTPANQQTLLAVLEGKMQIIAGKPLRNSDATQVHTTTPVRYNPTDDKSHHGLNEAVQVAVRNVSNIRVA